MSSGASRAGPAAAYPPTRAAAGVSYRFLSGKEFARRWRDERRYEQIMARAQIKPALGRFPYPARTCAEWS